jgi:hypothetical protein
MQVNKNMYKPTLGSALFVALFGAFVLLGCSRTDVKPVSQDAINTDSKPVGIKTLAEMKALFPNLRALANPEALSYKPKGKFTVYTTAPESGKNARTNVDGDFGMVLYVFSTVEQVQDFQESFLVLDYGPDDYPSDTSLSRVIGESAMSPQPKKKGNVTYTTCLDGGAGCGWRKKGSGWEWYYTALEN